MGLHRKAQTLFENEKVIEISESHIVLIFIMFFFKPPNNLNNVVCVIRLQFIGIPFFCVFIIGCFRVNKKMNCAL
jgi:hypothetical protein